MAGLHNIVKENEPDATCIKLAKVLIPRYTMWAAWKLNSARLLLWNTSQLDPYREKLSAVFALEGPDRTLQERGTLRQSSRGRFESLVSKTAPTEMVYLDRLLLAFDQSIEIGPETLHLFMNLCIEPGIENVRLQELRRLEAAVKLRSETKSKILKIYLQCGSDLDQWTKRMEAVTAVLPIMTEHQVLQVPYGHDLCLACHAKNILEIAQKTLLSGWHYFDRCGCMKD
ncbi:hypothetical protein CcaCcLH18_00740 [Colletotrichum camelliae]|nr:hypothetical protein CcaCcLH18_00740 [Colletotrichum camelliae]